MGLLITFPINFFFFLDEILYKSIVLFVDPEIVKGDSEMGERSIVHLNIIGFRAAVAAAKDRALRGRPFVIAGASGGHSLAMACSPEAINQGITPGMTLAAAGRRVKDLAVLPPDPPAYEKMNQELEQVANRYAPVWENDRVGNLYFDITGTTGLFGPPEKCSHRILNDIFSQTEIRPATAVACNKLVSKVASRTIRPVGFVRVRYGTEAEFMAPRDIGLLPGMGPELLHAAAVTGIREIGELAALSVPQALSLFGKQGPLLRTMAQGIDPSRVEERREERSIVQRADFPEDVIDETAIRGAIEALAEKGGIEMRKGKLGVTIITLVVYYADGVRAEGREEEWRPCVLDRDIAAAAERVYAKIAVRRIRIRSLGLALEGLIPLSYQPDLFEPEAVRKNRHLQEAVDRIQGRYGTGAVTTALVLAAMRTQGRKNGTGKIESTGFK